MQQQQSVKKRGIEIMLCRIIGPLSSLQTKNTPSIFQFDIFPQLGCRMLTVY